MNHRHITFFEERQPYIIGRTGDNRISLFCSSGDSKQRTATVSFAHMDVGEINPSGFMKGCLDQFVWKHGDKAFSNDRLDAAHI